jgi:hypothetical protein
MASIVEDGKVAALPNDRELNARFDHVQIDDRPEGLRMRFDTPLTQYKNSAGCGWALVTVLLLIHGFLGYVNLNIAAPPPVHIIPHAVVAPFTLYFLYNTLTTGTVRLDVQVERNTFRVQMSGSTDSTLLETPISNIEDIRSKIAAPEHPERGHAIRVHCREDVNQGSVQNAMASVGEATGGYEQHTGHLDPRKAPEIPLYLPTKDMADILAARLRNAVQR